MVGQRENVKINYNSGFNGNALSGKMEFCVNGFG
jgi:uncharacterized protein YvpB